MIEVSHKNMDFDYDWNEWLCIHIIIVCADKVEQIRWAIIISVVVLFAYASTDMCVCVCVFVLHA